MIYINRKNRNSFKDRCKKFHRLNGPAIITESFQSWWTCGKRHRLNGPAIIFHNGDKSWYIEGKGYAESEYHEKIKELGL